MKIKTMIKIGILVGTTAAAGTIFAASAKSIASRKNGTKVSDFENLIDNQGVPVNYDESQYESRIAPFADLGSWHAFSLPDYNHRNFWGGFSQPLIVRKEYPRSFSKSFDILSIKEFVVDSAGKVVPHSQVIRSLGSLPNNKVHLKQYPGGLWQEYEFDDFTLQLDLKFVQNKTSFVKYNIVNKSNRKKAFELIWKGKIFLGANNVLGTKIIANGKHTNFEVESNGSNYPVKYNDFGQPLIDTKNLYTDAPNEGVLYITEDVGKGLSKNTNSKTSTIAIGSNGHAPDSENRWYAIGKVAALESWFGLNGGNFVVAYKNRNSVVKTDGKWNYDSNKPFSTFIPDKSKNNQSQNALQIHFNKPTSKYSNNFLGHDDEWQWDMQFQKDTPVNITVSDDKQSYEAKISSPFFVNANSNNSLFVGSSFTFTAQERFGFKYEGHGDNKGESVLGQLEVSNKALANKLNSQKLFDKSKKRWELYIKNLLGNYKDNNKNFKYQKVAVKAMETLVNNWRGNAGMLEHQGVTPSISIQWFNEFWSWDTWKQATAEVNFDPKLAIDNMKVMFDYQVTRNPQSNKFYNYSSVRQKNDVGMIPDLVAYEQSETNWRDTKPPLSAWGAFNVLNTILNKLDPNQVDPHSGKTYKQLAIDFGKYIYNRIIAYHLWWYSNRDGDHNGVNEYGGTIFDGSGSWVNNSKETITTAAAWESGMDNAPRFDAYGSNKKNDKLNNFDDGLEYTLQRNHDGTVTGYVLQQESVDLNAYMYAEKKYIIKIANILKSLGVKYNEIQGSPQKVKKDLTYKYLVKPGVIDRLAEIHKYDGTKNIFKDFGNSFSSDIKSLSNDMIFLKNYVNNKMFDSKTGFYYDLKWKLSNDGKTRDVTKDKILSNRGAGPEGFIPLWAGMVTSDNSEKVRNLIMDPKGFNTYMPFPTASYNNDKFEPDQYWRGPVWLDQAYFGVQGLKRNGFKRDASYMVDKLFNNADGLLEGKPIRENYNPLTGEGLNAKGFSWSSGMYLLMYKNYIKVGE